MYSFHVHPFENSVNSAGNETRRSMMSYGIEFENSVNFAGNETQEADDMLTHCLRTLLILQVMKRRSSV